jgi:hypothetical protein
VLAARQMEIEKDDAAAAATAAGTDGAAADAAEAVAEKSTMLKQQAEYMKQTVRTRPWRSRAH